MEDGHFYFDKEENKFYSSKGGKSYEDIFKDIKEIKEDFTFHEIADVISDFSSLCKVFASVIKVFHCISLCKSGYAARTKLQYVSCLSRTCNNFLSTSNGSHNF